ncbi:MAG: arsenite methyltransferase [Opitutae bacterium]|nr:arsenite methyltransferase [Opitutae bacterium]
MSSYEKLAPDQIRDYVRDRYGAIATQSDRPAASGCCSTASGSACCATSGQAYGEKLGYSATELAAAPAGSDLGLGCGNPIALASIRPGETVLDLGSGAGFDCFLAARQLNGTGHVIGVDMTPAMIAKARGHVRKSGFANVEFRLGEIEHLPVADATVDLIISNCVVNLSPEKPQVFREAFRVLKSGGRLALSDIVALQPLPERLRNQLAEIGACIGGASLVSELEATLRAAGFARVEVVPKPGSRELIASWSDDPTVADFVVSANITAYKA